MKFTPEELIDLVERASTLSERRDWLNGEISPSPPGSFSSSSTMQAEERLQRWCQVVAKGDNAVFEQRLALAGLTRETARQLVTGVAFPEQLLPSWAPLLNEVMAVGTDYPDAVRRSLFPTAPLAFEEVFLPFLAIAQIKLNEQVGKAYDQLTDKAHASLERGLLWRLVQPCGRAFELEFSLFRNQRQSDLDRLLGQLRGTASNTQYQAFIKTLATGGLKPFWQKYPVLARLTAITLEQWLETTGEFLLRLNADQPALQAMFSAETNWGLVTDIHPAMSDLHHGGRSVMGLRFASGATLIYKPRNIGLESAYFQLLEWLNQEDATVSPFRTVKTLNCSTHGWVEYVPYEPCQTTQSVEHYYWQSGRLLALVYALQGTDFHYDNLIVSADQPVLVDLEMLFHPVETALKSMGELSQAQRQTIQKIDESVLRTLLLPRTFVLGGQHIEVSALGNTGAQSVKAQRFDHVNTDSMAWVEETSTLPSLTNSPFAPGITGSFEDYIDVVVDGFTQMYCLLLRHQAELLAADGPLATFTNQPSGRYIHRHTTTYYALRQRAFHPTYVGDGADFSIELDVCSRTGLTTGWTSQTEQLINAELRSLERLDIPHFVLNSSGCDLLVDETETIANFLPQSGFDCVMERVQQLSEADRQHQIELIRYSVNTQSIWNHYWEEPPIAPSVLNLASAESASQQTVTCPVTPCGTGAMQLVQQAITVAQEIERRAILGNDGSISWAGLNANPYTRQLQLSPLETCFYDGTLGTALFLAAAERGTGDQRWRPLISSTLNSIEKLMHSFEPEQCIQSIRAIGMGGGMGWGGILYTLTTLSQWLKDPTLLEAAEMAASLITPRFISDDRQFDLLSGAAGALLSLLTLHQVTANSALLELAHCCGEHLVNQATLHEGRMLWLSSDGKPLTGLAHGTAGIAYALERLFVATSNPQFLTTAKEAIEGEYTAVTRLLDSTSVTEQPVALSWANGISGILLARLAMRSLPAVENNPIDSLWHYVTASLGDVDALYTGTFGQLETLCLAAQLQQRPDLLSQVQQLAAVRVADVQTDSPFRLFVNDRAALYNPTFFHGTAGIGYQLLRFAQPDRFPSILLWEPTA